MKQRSIVVLVLAAVLALAPMQVHAGLHSASSSIKIPGWLKVVGIATFVCATSIVGAAVVKNSQQNKPLTASEATSCGWKFWVRRP
jgi:hypothetical protein